MCGCVSAEPSSRGCGVSARPPAGVTRRLSFSTPRRIPLRRSGSIIQAQRYLIVSCMDGMLYWDPWMDRAKYAQVAQGRQLRYPGVPDGGYAKHGATRIALIDSGVDIKHPQLK